MRCSNEIDKIAAALHRVQGAMPKVTRSATNPHFHSTYTPIEEVYDAALAACQPNGVSLLQGCHSVDHVGFMLETIALHSSGQWIAQDVWFPIQRKQKLEEGALFTLEPNRTDQAGTLTYARRIGACTLLCIAGDEDSDGGIPDQPRLPERGAVAKERPVEGPPGTGIPKRCPVCGEKVWDNREKKGSGEYEWDSKDWICADKQCKTEGYRTGGWLTKDGRKPKSLDDYLAGHAHAPKAEPKGKSSGPGKPGSLDTVPDAPEGDDDDPPF